MNKINKGDVLKTKKSDTTNGIEFKYHNGYLLGEYCLYLGYQDCVNAYVVQELSSCEHYDEIDFYACGEFMFVTEEELYSKFDKVTLKKYKIIDKCFGRLVIE